MQIFEFLSNDVCVEYDPTCPDICPVVAIEAESGEEADSRFAALMEQHGKDRNTYYRSGLVRDASAYLPLRTRSEFRRKVYYSRADLDERTYYVVHNDDGSQLWISRAKSLLA